MRVGGRVAPRAPAAAWTHGWGQHYPGENALPAGVLLVGGGLIRPATDVPGRISRGAGLSLVVHASRGGSGALGGARVCVASARGGSER